MFSFVIDLLIVVTCSLLLMHFFVRKIFYVVFKAFILCTLGYKNCRIYEQRY